VAIYVSTGVLRVPVPSVTGLLADSARQQLTAIGFEVLIDFIPAETPDQINRVVAQTPPANIELREGEAVTIVIGIEPEPEETTTTTPAVTTTTVATTTTTVADG
jgi:beta-lactam-binding protein with PASTA domain